MTARGSTPSRSLVAAIGRCSSSHPWLAIGAWFAFVALAVGSMVATGDKTLQNGAAGESARGYTMLDQNRVRGFPSSITRTSAATR